MAETQPSPLPNIAGFTVSAARYFSLVSDRKSGVAFVDCVFSSHRSQMRRQDVDEKKMPYNRSVKSVDPSEPDTARCVIGAFTVSESKMLIKIDACHVADHQSQYITVNYIIWNFKHTFVPFSFLPIEISVSFRLATNKGDVLLIVFRDVKTIIQFSISSKSPAVY